MKFVYESNSGSAKFPLYSNYVAKKYIPQSEHRGIEYRGAHEEDGEELWDEVAPSLFEMRAWSLSICENGLSPQPPRLCCEIRSRCRFSAFCKNRCGAK